MEQKAAHDQNSVQNSEIKSTEPGGMPRFLLPKVLIREFTFGTEKGIQKLHNSERKSDKEDLGSKTTYVWEKSC